MSLQIFDGLYERASMWTCERIRWWEVDALVSLAGANAITICPFVGQGESSLRLQRMSDGSEPQHGDTWAIAQGAWGSTRCLVLGSVGGGDDKPRLILFPNGDVNVGAGGRFYSPYINTEELRIDATNVYEIFQRNLTAVSTSTPLLADTTLPALAAGTSITLTVANNVVTISALGQTGPQRA